MKKTLLAISFVALTSTPVAYAKSATKEVLESDTDNSTVFIAGGAGALYGAAVGGPIGFAVGGIVGLLVGTDSVNQSTIENTQTELADVQAKLAKEQDALLAVNKQLSTYRSTLDKTEQALNKTNVALRQAKLSELMTQVQFKTGEADISPVFHQHLDKLVNIMQQDPDLNLTIQGHADSRGNEKYNMALSKQRADNIKSYLAKSGVASQRMSVVAVGENHSQGEHFEEHFFDRKVVMTLKSKNGGMTVRR